jgi:peptidoglycan-associated lipoprotein
MKHSPGLHGVLAIVCCSGLGVACGGAQPPAASSPGAVAAPPSSPAAPTSAASASPSASQVAISDEIRAKCGISDEDAYFSFDSSRLTSSDRTPLDQVVKCFTGGPLKGHSLKLVGRADPRGDTEYNMTLGQARADAVGQYLATRGMSKSKAQSTSRGAMDASGTSEATWQKDRRVDVVLGD